jgi:hypothetical protein
VVQIIPDLLLPLFVLLVLAIVCAAVMTVVLLAQGSPFAAAFRPLGSLLVLYAALLAIGSATSRERRVPLGTLLCFGDWCATVDNVQNAAASPDHDRVVTADVRITSVAKRVEMRGSHPAVYLIDADGTWYQARTSDTDRRLDDAILAGQSFASRVHATVPGHASIVAARIWEGAFLDKLVPFDEESPLHRKTFLTIR